MNLQDLNNRVDANRSNNAAVNRAAATADPSFDAGMDDPFDSFDNVDSGGAFDSGFGDNSGGFGDGGFGGDAFSGGGLGQDAFGGGDSFGGGSFGGNSNFGLGGGNFGIGGGFGQQQPQQTDKSTEDKIIDAAGKAGKASIGFFKELTQSFKGITPVTRATWGRYATTAGIIAAVIGVLLWILLNPNVGLEILVGALISAGTGVIILCFGQSEVTPDTQQPQQQVTDDFNWSNDADNLQLPESFQDGTYDEEVYDESDAWDENSNWDDSDASWDDNSGDDSWGDSWDEPEQDSVSAAVNTAGVDTAAAMEALDNVQGNGLYDRRALFERQLSVLRNITPNYGKSVPISESDALFSTIDAIVQESAEQLKPSGTNDVPYLISAMDTLFYIRLEISRPKYIKNVQQYTQEIVNVFQYDKNSGTRDTSIYGIGEVVGSRIYIKLMKGETAFVSLKDVYDTNSAEILDYNNKMPIVMGVNIEGMPVIRDFFNMESILITGAPRTGKSWFMLAILYQMMAYMSPEELNIYLFDPKGAMSDLTSLTTPHVKTFVSDDNAIVAYLRYIVTTLGSERKEFLGAAGYKTIKDYNKEHPEKKLPYIYVVIDEVVTLAERMPDETKKEFQGLLTQLVSQLPAAGIRLFMVPHLVKDQIIKKTTTQLIPCRVSVKGNPEHIENSCGIKNFPHALTHTGDLCVRLDDTPDGMFVHAIALAKENSENTALFNYLGAMWAKICPESVPGSLYEKHINHESLVCSPEMLTFMRGSNSGVQQTASTSQAASTKTRRSSKTKAVPADTRSTSSSVYDEIPSQFGTPFDNSNQSWGHNQITDNGRALNDIVDLFDDDM